MASDRKRKVVVVDDSEIVRTSVAAALEERGWEVVTFDNAFGVASRILGERPDVLLLDVNMPLLSGEGVVRALSKAMGLRPKQRTTRIILYSDRSTAELRELVTRTAAHAFIRKGDDFDALDRKLHSFLDKNRR